MELAGEAEECASDGRKTLKSINALNKWKKEKEKKKALTWSDQTAFFFHLFFIRFGATLLLESGINLLCACMVSRVQLFVTPWTVDHQASLSMGFSRQEHRSGLSIPPPGDLLNSGIKPTSPVSPELAELVVYHWDTWEALAHYKHLNYIKT